MLSEVQRKVKALLFATLLISGEVHQVRADIRLNGGASTSGARSYSDPDTQGLALEAMMNDAAFQGQGNAITEQLRSVFTNPTFQAESKRVTELMEALVTDPHFQKQVKRTEELIEEMMASPKMEAQAKRVAEMMADANLQEHIKYNAEHIKGLEELTTEKVQEMMSDPSLQKHAKLMGEEMTAMLTSEQAKNFASELEAMMGNQVLQERAKHLGEQMTSFMSKPIMQKQVKALEEHLGEMAAKYPGKIRVTRESAIDRLVDRVADKMFDQALKLSPMHYDDLESTTLGSAWGVVNEVGTVCGTATAAFFLLSPMLQIATLLKKRDAASLELINPITQVAILLNCSMWVWFALFAHIKPPLYCNALGAVAGIFYIVTCWIMKFKVEGSAPSWGTSAAVLSGIAPLFSAGIAVAAAFNENFATVVGFIATAFNLILYSSALTVTKEVIQTKNSAKLPPVQCWMQFANTIFWCIVGVAVVFTDGATKAAPIMIANFPGLAFAITQLSLIFTYPAKIEQVDNKKKR